MRKETARETTEANKSISRPDGKPKGATAATATGRHGVAAKAIVDKATDESETARVAGKAGENDRRR